MAVPALLQQSGCRGELKFFEHDNCKNLLIVLKDVHTKIIYWRDMLERSINAEMKDLMTYLYQLSQLFHRNHYFILEIKRRVIELISKMPEYTEGKVATAYMERKVEYCRDLLAVQQLVAPGYSELRSYLSNHIAAPLYWISKVFLRSFISNRLIILL